MRSLCFTILVVLLLVPVLLAACSPAAPGTSTAEPDFTGWVIQVKPGNGRGNGEIIVESQTDKIVRRLTVKVTAKTRLVRQEDGELRPIDLADIAPQDQARIWIAGSLPRTFPARASARQVIVEKRY